MKKKTQLGMDPGTASNRLVKDVLFKLLSELKHRCHHCGLEMSRKDFSIEHKVPWLDSDDPVTLFFDLDNVAFSHIGCNVGARRQTKKAMCGTRSKYTTGCRCDSCKAANAAAYRDSYTPEARSARYRRTGK
ncbi:hypothetical protein [Pseudomonas sp. lyk4-TYG-107]|uniref:HNH endonuclease n=1 Tax=Pseudomonas sp. lyk4-TYG-107 TaxID=3040317 RepID=UPI0025532B60|nr:hypothetical protein [Pseudomonas sp. lyk4-TYG-107]